MSGVHEGDVIKAIGNHCYKGREGVVQQVEDVDGKLYIHVLLNDSGETIIIRGGQYKVVRQGSPENRCKTLLDEIRPHLERVRNNKRYSYGTRIEVLSGIGDLCDKMLVELCGERDAEERKVKVPDPVEPKMGRPQNNVVPNIKRFSLNRGRHWDRKRH